MAQKAGKTKEKAKPEKKEDKDYRGLRTFTPGTTAFILLIIAAAIVVQTSYDPITNASSLDRLSRVLSFHRLTFSLQELDLAIFLAGLTLISYAFLLGPLVRMFPYKFDDYIYPRRAFGLVGFWLLLLHSLYYSVAVYSLNNSQLALTDPPLLGTLLGFIGIVILFIGGITSSEKHMVHIGFYGWKKLHRVGYVGLAFIILNVLLINRYNISGPIVSPFSAIFLSLGTFAILMRIIVAALHKPPIIEDY